MSVEAMIWAMQLAPVPMDAGGKGRPPKDGDKKVTPHPSSACAFVLLGLANHAGPDGADAFPSTATLARYTRLSERIVQKCLDRLEADGVIRPSDPAIIAAKIRRADRRPKGWDTFGWACPADGCGYTQEWAHGFMADPAVLADVMTWNPGWWA